VCRHHDVGGLVYRSLSVGECYDDWPADLHAGLARLAHADAACELVRQREVSTVLTALATRGVFPFLLKGTPLAYAAYPSPALRPRADTDLLVTREQADVVRKVLSELGYVPTTYCEGELLFCQFEMQRHDEFDVAHAFDVHWKISTQTIFKELVAYDELTTDSHPVPALGPHAQSPGPIHTLLIACVHPVMHHRNIERLIWVHDIHLVASQLSDDDIDRFVDLAVDKQVAAVCAHALAVTNVRSPSSKLARALARLTLLPPSERSATYLRPNRRWHHELVANLMGLPRWRDRFQLMREVVLPPANYMLGIYAGTDSTPRAALLPMLYIRRLTRGVWKIAVGRK